MLYRGLMRKTLYIFFIVFLQFQLLADYAFAEVITQSTTKLLPRFEQQFAKLKENDLVIFDLDNTVFRESQMLGTDEWYDYILHKMEAEENLSGKAARAKLEPLNNSIKNASNMKLMEEELPLLIRELQKRKVYVLALTSRHPNLSAITVRKLKELGIDFSKHSLPVDKVEGFSLAKYNHGFLFHGGIAFSDGAPKGMVLKDLLEYMDMRPGKVIAMDDRIHHIHTLSEALIEMKIHGIVIHYLKSREEDFLPQIADIQLQHFVKTGLILSDEKATSKLASCDHFFLANGN